METSAVAAARALSPLIKSLRQQTEADRRPAPAIVTRLVDTRLCRMAIAKELDGLELPVLDALEVYEILAGAEASVAWIVWNSTLPGFFSRYLDAATRAELFGDPTWIYACSTRPTGKAIAFDDGYRIRGRWSLVSGCELAEWLLLACVVHDGEAPRRVAPGVPETRMAFVRRGAFEVLDTWHVGGMRGTGSHDVVIEEAHVPREWTLSPADATTLPRPIGRVPIICTLAAGFASQTLGVARSAIDTLISLASSKVQVDSGLPLSERPAVQELIARRTAALDAARDLLRRRASELWQVAARDEEVSLEAITAVWAAAHHAVDAAKVSVESAYAAAGTAALYTDCPLERAHRDLHAMLRHVVAQPVWVEDAGKVTLGMTPSRPLYAI
jgi:alkylation response protein AidB-like acyl-CoA dehydrogenase